jgi:HEAT repeat protein
LKRRARRPRAKSVRKRKRTSDWARIVAAIKNVEDDVDGAVAATFELDKAATRAWLPRLHRLLARGRDFFIREAAAVPIARLQGLRALSQLLHALHLGSKEGHDNDGLGSIVAGLVSTDPARAAPILRRMIHARSERDRRDAAWLWGTAAPAVPLEPLLDCVNDRSAAVRSAAVGSLSSFAGGPGVFDALVRALSDPDEQTGVNAAAGLGYLGDARAIPKLRKALRDPKKRVREFARYALERLEKPDA